MPEEYSHLRICILPKQANHGKLCIVIMLKPEDPTKTFWIGRSMPPDLTRPLGTRFGICGGFIRVESEEGKGSTFIVSLPMIQDANAG